VWKCGDAQMFGTRGAFGRGSLAAALARFGFWWGIEMGRAESRAIVTSIMQSRSASDYTI
jgi:hypothetical protein